MDKNPIGKKFKHKVYKFFNNPMIKLEMNGERIDSNKVFEDGACCPNLWVIPTYIMKLFLIYYVGINLYTIGNIKGVTNEIIDYVMLTPIPENHPLRD